LFDPYVLSIVDVTAPIPKGAQAIDAFEPGKRHCEERGDGYD